MFRELPLVTHDCATMAVLIKLSVNVIALKDLED